MKPLPKMQNAKKLLLLVIMGVFVMLAQNTDALIKNISISFDPEYINMSNTCRGEIGFKPDSDDSFQVCVVDEDNTSTIGCKTYNSGEFNKSTNITTDFFRGEENKNYGLKFSWNRIKYLNMNNSAINGFNDSGETDYDPTVDDLCVAGTGQTNNFAYTNSDCTGSQDTIHSFTNGGNTYKEWCGEASSFCDDEDSTSGRVYEGYVFSGGSNQTFETVWTGGYGCRTDISCGLGKNSCEISSPSPSGFVREWAVTCNNGNPPNFPQNLCSSISNSNDKTVNLTKPNSGKLISFNGNVKSQGLIYLNQSDKNFPLWSNNKTNASTILNDTVSFNVSISDNIALDKYIFSHNISGFWLNLTTQPVPSTTNLNVTDVTDAEVSFTNVSQGSNIAIATALNNESSSDPTRESKGTLTWSELTPDGSYIDDEESKSGFLFFRFNADGKWDFREGDYITLSYDNKKINISMPLFEDSNDHILWVATDGSLYNDINLTDIKEINNMTIFERDSPKNFTVQETLIINESRTKHKGWTVYFNDTGGNNNQTDIFTFDVDNIAPDPFNVSMTPLPVSEGQELKGHGLYQDADGDKAGGNSTFWYINNSVVLTAEDSFTLKGNNVSEFANITFSICYNDTIDETCENSSTATVGDSTPPTLINNRTSPASVTVDNSIDLIVNVSDNVGSVSQVKAEVLNPNQQKSNLSMSLDSGSTNNGQWKTSFTPSVTGTHNVTFYAQDGSSNEDNTDGLLSFEVTEASTSSGGGGGGSTTIVESNKTPSLFFGLTGTSFLVVSAPSESTKIIKFENRGTGALQDATVEVLGEAKPFIVPRICKTPEQDCKSEDISIKSGETAFLNLQASFTPEIGSGKEGIIRIEEQGEKGKTFDLTLSIDRPLAYELLIEPISSQEGYRNIFQTNELPALILGYGAFIGVLTMFGLFVRFML